MLNKLFQEAYLKLCFTVKPMAPCQILNLTEDVNVIEDGQIEILLTAMVHRVKPYPFPSRFRNVSFQSVSENNSDYPTGEYGNAAMKPITVWVIPKLNNNLMDMSYRPVAPITHSITSSLPQVMSPR